MGKHLWLVLALTVVTPPAWAQSKPATAPANETRTPSAIRSPHSMAGDLKVPMCPSQFHDSLAGNGIAGPHARGVTRPQIKSTVAAKVTQQAIRASHRTHFGNYVVLVNVVVDTSGNPTHLCLEKSSGYGLDAAAAAAVRRYRFRPATKAGKPVKMRVPVEVRFGTETPPQTTHPLRPK